MNPGELLNNLPSKAGSRNKEFRKTIKRLQQLRSGDAEQRIREYDAQVFQHIDCLECGNCCRTLGPRLIQRDIQRLAKICSISTAAFMEKYLKKDEDGDWVFRSMPCPFLEEDNYCSVYSHRPKACADYPHTRGRQIRSKLGELKKNAAVCPGVYGILDSLGKHI